ncbi:hypothetical protein [Stenotrophomonas indicatrix]
MKLDGAVRLALMAAMTFGSYINTAEAASCLVSQTMTMENCPVGGTGPKFPGGDATGDPPNTDPNRMFFAIIPVVPGNPYPVTCSSSVDDKVRSASYNIRYFIAYETARLGADPNFPRNTLFYILMSDGKFQTFMDIDATVYGAPQVTGSNVEINGLADVCWNQSQPWTQLGDNGYLSS